MTLKERKAFIRQLVNDVKKDMLSKANKMPSSWDGMELREYVKDCFSEVVITGTISRSRKMEYKNFVLVNNL